MFATYAVFKHRLQLNQQSTAWRAVEVILPTPWLIATIADQAEEVNRTFLLTGNDEILLFAERPSLGKPISLHLMLTPDWSETGDWMLLPIAKVERQAVAPEGVSPLAYVTGTNGKTYGGFPIAPVVLCDEERVSILELPHRHAPLS